MQTVAEGGLSLRADLAILASSRRWRSRGGERWTRHSRISRGQRPNQDEVIARPWTGLAQCCAHCSRQNTGRPCSDSVPPLPGPTPPTTLVPYSRAPAVWKAPALPVIPWQITLVSLSTSMLILLRRPSLFAFHLTVAQRHPSSCRYARSTVNRPASIARQSTVVHAPSGTGCGRRVRDTCGGLSAAPSCSLKG